MEKALLLEKILTEPKPLSDTQRRAVICDKPYIRVIAGAGAGKTETLTRKIVKLLLIDNVSPSEIVAFTFTEKAAQSMKSRVYKRVKGLGANEICARLGEMYLGTIHGYSKRLLEDHGGYGNYGVLDENQEMAYLLRVGYGLHFHSSRSYPSTCEIFSKNLNVVYGEMLNEAILERRAPSFFKSLKAYEDVLENVKQLTFNSMISLAVQHLTQSPQTVDRVKHLIVDEYQDINRAQEAFIRLIGRRANIFIVGDPRQTIYQWRGSDEGCFEDFAIYYPDVQTLTITENRRSAASIVRLSNKFADTFESHHYDHMAEVRSEPGGIYCVECDSDGEEARWVAEQIQEYVNAGRCSYGHIGILLRSVTTSGPPFIDEFRRRGIPFVVGGKVGLFRRSEVQAVGKLVAWLSDHGFFQRDKWSFREKIHGDDLFLTARVDWHDAIPEMPAASDEIDQLQDWKKNVLNGTFKNFTEMYYALLGILRFSQLDPDNREHAVIMANLGRFSEMLTDYETANSLGGKRRNWQTDMNGLCWFINTYATSSYEEQAGDDIRGIDAVQLMTIHQSKGLEWPLVFVPAVVDQRFPSRMVGREGTWMIPRDMFDVAKYEGNIESERNLMYVALTRAKDVLVVSAFTSLNDRDKAASQLLTKGDWTEDMTFLTQRNRLPVHQLSISSTDDEELQTFTAGELIRYSRCPHQYRLSEIWGYQPGLNEYLGYGKALHHCLRHAGEIMKSEGCGPMSAVITAIEREFFMPFMPERRFLDIKKAAKEALLRFVCQHEQDMFRIRDIESRIEFPLQNAIVAGKVDVILHDGDAIEVREYKSADTSASPDEVALQVRLYSQGLRSIGEDVRHGSVAFLQEARVENVGVSDEEVQQVVTTTHQYIAGIIGRRFTACPGHVCEYCDQGTICRWRAGGES